MEIVYDQAGHMLFVYFIRADMENTSVLWNFHMKTY